MAVSHPAYAAVITTPVGLIGIQTSADALLALAYLSADHALRPPADAFTRRVVRQLERYFDRPTSRFSIAVTLDGTAFQRRVWQALIKLPAGRVLSYGALAERLHTGARAVGNACRVNPVPIVVPCHRIVASRGLGGYGGQTSSGNSIAIKRWLLDHEQGMRG